MSALNSATARRHFPLARTSNGVVYAAVPTCASYPDCPSNALVVYRANAAGTPASFAPQNVERQPIGGIGSSAIAIDDQDRLHILWNDRDGHAHYSIFDTVTNRWGTVVTLDATGWTDFGQGDEGVALALNRAGNPHAAWTARDIDGRLRVRYANRIGGGWSTPAQVDDVTLTQNRNARHPTLAFGPDRSLWLA